MDHIVVDCVFARQIWVDAATAMDVQLTQPPAGAILDWWEAWRGLWPQEFPKGADSLFALISWELC